MRVRYITICTNLFYCVLRSYSYIFFFFNDTATTEIYTLSLHDALPISGTLQGDYAVKATLVPPAAVGAPVSALPVRTSVVRSEEHTSELQSRLHLVCRLLLEKKKKIGNYVYIILSYSITIGKVL